MKTIRIMAMAVAAVGLAATSLPACGSDPRSDGTCAASCSDLIVVGSPEPQVDACDSTIARAAEDWYACVCQYTHSSVGTISCTAECQDDCAGGPLSDDCKSCVAVPCKMQFDACVGQ